MTFLYYWCLLAIFTQNIATASVRICRYGLLKTFLRKFPFYRQRRSHYYNLIQCGVKCMNKISNDCYQVKNLSCTATNFIKNVPWNRKAHAFGSQCVQAPTIMHGLCVCITYRAYVCTSQQCFSLSPQYNSSHCLCFPLRLHTKPVQHKIL